MVVAQDNQRAQIPEFYAGRSIFITGGTGFMGKVLIERLLSTCPDIGRIYLLMRQKKGVSPDQRLSQLKQSQVFDVVRQTSPSQLDKLAIIPGDTMKPELGIATEDIAQLRQVSVVFHGAATLRFDEAMPVAVDQNVRSVIRLMEICDSLPNIEALIHVSTAYSNADLQQVEEKVYQPPADLAGLLALTDTVPGDVLAAITPKYIAPKPNTYTFTKAMAEYAIQQHGTRNYPIAIFRPTIVISSQQHPFPGWIENLNGPSGIIVGAGKGLLHVFCCKTDAKADMIPVDIAIDSLMAVAWETAVDKSEEVKVYHCSSFENPTTWQDFEIALRKYLREHPLNNAYWYPCGSIATNKYTRKALEIVLQTIPLHLADYAMRMLGVKPQISLITVNQRLTAMTEVLTFFSMREWEFKTDNMRKLHARLSPADAAIYNLDPQTIKWDEQYGNFVKGTRKYLLKEKEQDLGEARKHLFKMMLLHNGMLFLTLLLFLRVLLQNKIIRDVVYGTIKMLLSLFSTAYSRSTPA